MTNKAQRTVEVLELLYPNADCELIHHNVLDLTVAVMLSAQTTDKQVNVVTPALFEKYPTLESYAQADIAELEQDIKKIGLYKSKAKNIIGMANRVLLEYDGIIPNSINELITLSGIGRKTANVVISVGYGKPGFAVDTHVERVSKRLNLVKGDDTINTIEKKMKHMFPRDKWSKLHHQMIFFGRYFCKARTPSCEACPLQASCVYYKKKL